MSHGTSVQSPVAAGERIRAHLAAALALALIVLALVAGVLSLVVSNGAADTASGATGAARFGGYEAGIAAVVKARQASTGRDESRVAAAIAGD